MDGGRYRDGLGFYSATLTTPGARELTLIEEERLDEVARDGLPLGPGEHRRNVTTRSVALDGLLGRRFRIGGVLFEGVRARPPCNHLAIGRAPLEAGTHGRDELVDVEGLRHDFRRRHSRTERIKPARSPTGSQTLHPNVVLTLRSAHTTFGRRMLQGVIGDAMDRGAVGQRIREARKAARLTQAALAGRTGVALTTIINIEKGRSLPTLDTVWSFAGALGADPRHLAFGDDDRVARRTSAETEG